MEECYSWWLVDISILRVAALRTLKGVQHVKEGKGDVGYSIEEMSGPKGRGAWQEGAQLPPLFCMLWYEN